MTMQAAARVWPSRITAQMLVAGAAAPGEIRVDGPDIWWSESRPDEGGRIQLVRRTPEGVRNDVLPEGTSARTRVHEYGGGAWAVSGGTVAFVDFDDQRVKLLAPDAGGAPPSPISPDPSDRHALRYADLVLDVGGGRVLAVRERHRTGGNVVNDLVALPLDGSAADDPGAVAVLAEGADFYASPALDATGSRLAFIRWNMPDMPWDATELVVQELTSGAETVVAGGPGESIVAPQWAPDGSLTFSSDRSNWWNPYRWSPTSCDVTVLAPVDAEIGGPLWVFGLRYLAWLPDGRFACSLTGGGTDKLAVAAADGTPPTILETPFTHISQVVAGPDGSVLVVAGTPADESAPYLVTVADDPHEPPHVERLRPARDLGLGEDPSSWFSAPTAVVVPVEDGAITHALVFGPTNPDVDHAGAAALPPLLVLTHGGPTSATRAQLNLTIQFWTSRGFCVADVNHRGSTGYGRAFRDSLRGRWGIADVADCVAVARHLADTGVVDPARLGIRGGSAGGFTTLAALTFHDTFTAGASSYGIADLELLATDTHKFEARYLDSLVGPWPEDAATYQARSPIHHLEGLNCPVAIFQGAEDEIVPPNQAELIVETVRAKGLPYAAITFLDEGHGFRKAPNIVRALEGELWFFSRAFGLALDEDIEPLDGQGLADG
jgi:dipeptidyl aminopeptidase/acylaminoacyl peptidase